MFVIVFATAAMAVGLGGCDLFVEDDSDDASSDGGAGTTEESSGEADVPSASGIPEIVSEVEPSVVTVLRDGGVGSGVIIDDGIIVTNAHVVEGVDEVVVQLATGRRLDADVLAFDLQTDLAVLDTGEDGLPAATFADSLPRVGALAVAIGSPLGLENTVTAGIVSGINRAVPAGPRTPQALVNLVQTDAPIAPGNSGGALVGADAQVIGINVAYLPPGQTGATAIGFAIPSPTVVDVVEQLIETGDVEHAFLGIQPGPLTSQIIERFGLEVEEGALVVGIVPDTPAEEVGMETGDVVTAIDDEPIRGVPDLLGVLRSRDPGDEIDVTVQRGDEELTFSVELVDQPEQFSP